ncbi:DUF1349 domain-containing protein [Cohnella silvisoli]|uniref:DUF1349 domain-containing protein n=1 Tax=Cohnella silvisoli TaxID=2873699 RepID=A0ABV1KT52_9BACL|nr:DUF1349 domain-containing protein [Cohnella silvisoli]MCD9021456.1 DUF1349 domain-containing protein [Cohnella silvisoli]
MKVKLIMVMMFFAAMVAILLVSVPERTAYAAGAIYYVSQSGGNDTNNGTSSSTPWKTLAKASTITYQPGDKLLLKSGDTWNEQLTLHGNGADGNVIQLSSYGSGSRPLIQRTNYNFNGDIGIYMKDLSHWIIQNIDFRQMWNGIMMEFETGLNKDITIQNVSFTDSPYAEYDPTYWPQKAARGFYTYVTPGNHPLNPVLDGLTFNNIYARNMGGGIHWEFGGSGNNGYAFKNVNVSDSVFEDGLFMQMSFLNTDGGSMKNVKFFNNGMTVDNGPANFAFYGNKNIDVSDLETAYNQRNASPMDGDGMDINDCHNCRFTRVLIHHNDGFGILESGGKPDQNFIMDNSVLYNDMINPAPIQAPLGDMVLNEHGSFVFYNSRLYPRTGVPLSSTSTESLVLKDTFVGDISSETNGLNLALSATATASTTYSGSTASNANDGSSSTSWRSASGTASDQWIQLDFGTARMVDKIVIEEDASSSISRFYLQYWDSSTSLWRDMYTGKTIGSSIYTNNMPFPGRLSSKIRLYVKSTTSGEPIIKEFKAYNNFYGKIDAFSNAGFETGLFTNWTTSGSAFGSMPFTVRHYGLSAWDGGYWGDSSSGGAATGTLTSANFNAGLKLSFLRAGWDGTVLQNNSYYYLRRASDNVILFVARPPQSDSFTPYEWDTSAYAGTPVYFQVVDGNSTSSFDWLAVDKLQVLTGASSAAAIPMSTSVTTSDLHDDFSTSTLNSMWSWVRQDSTKWSLTANPGSMQISTQPGELYQTTNDAKNILLRNAPDGDWTMKVKLAFNPTTAGQQAGVIVYQDDNNYLKLVRSYTASNRISFQKEVGGTFDNTYELLGVTATTVFLKIAKLGTTYTAYYNTDGSETWILLAQTTISGLNNTKVGLISYGGPTGPSADFDWFDIRKSQKTEEFEGQALNTRMWSWIREDNAKWSLTSSAGSMRIGVQPGELYQTTNTAKNLLLKRPSTADWTIKTKVSFNPTTGNQQAGLIVYQDDNNYLKLVRAYTASNRILLQQEAGGVFTDTYYLNGVTATTVYLMLVKSGMSYTAYYNTDGGESWTLLYQTTANLDSGITKFGLMSYGGPTGPNADFDWFDDGTPPIYTDDFNNSVLDSAWSWKWEDSTKWSLTASPGAVRIAAQAGELYQTPNTAKNLLLRSAPGGDWTMKTKLSYNPIGSNQQAGLIVYQDDDSYLKLVRANTISNRILFQQEIGGVFTDKYQLDNVTTTTVYLKLVKSGATYSSYYNTDGSETWSFLAQTTLSGLIGTYVGLLNMGGSGGPNADFDWFDIR